MVPAVEILIGRLIHPSVVEVSAPKCHACASDTNARDRGAAGVLCGRCIQQLDALLRRIMGPRCE